MLDADQPEISQSRIKLFRPNNVAKRTAEEKKKFFFFEEDNVLGISSTQVLLNPV